MVQLQEKKKELFDLVVSADGLSSAALTMDDLKAIFSRIPSRRRQVAPADLGARPIWTPCRSRLLARRFTRSLSGSEVRMRAMTALAGTIGMVLFGCQGTPPAEVEVAMGPVAAPETIAPAASKATHMSFGIIYAGDMMGELEPCGSHANPLGGLARRATVLSERRSEATAPEKPAPDPVWKDALIFDSGDAFSDMSQMDVERQKNAIATAELLVSALRGRGHARAEHRRARPRARACRARGAAEEVPLPVLTTNLVDATTGKLLFSRFVVIDVKRGDAAVKLAVFGLMSLKPQLGLDDDKLRIEPPVDALRAAIAEAKSQGAEMFVVLSQLYQRDAAAIGEAIPEVQLFLGGDSFGQEAELVGKALAFTGGQKGKAARVL